jgi:methyl-accepting chemotaxis protein
VRKALTLYPGLTMKFKHLKISTRLALCFAGILALSFFATAIAQWRLQQTAEQTRQMMEQPIAKERMISDWYRYIQVGVRRTSAIAKSNDTSLVTFFADDAAVTSRKASEMQKAVQEMLSNDSEKTVFDAIASERKIYTAAKDEIVAAKEAGDTMKAEKLIDTVFLPAASRYQAKVQELLELQRTNMNHLAQNIQQHYESSRWILASLSLAALLCGALFTWLLARNLRGELGGEPAYAADIARRIASGDLATEVVLHDSDRDSLLFAMKSMRDSLAEIVSQVRAGTETIATASDQIAAGNMDLSSRTEAQASALEQTAASMDELNSTVKQNADNARQANSLAGSASSVAQRGGDVVTQVVQTMHGINTSAGKITEIISVIDGIAFQTNILALNAAVEAARAGEQGRGFAVVATEVRNLAQRSAAAAKEIKALISDSVDQIHAGGKLVEEAGATMQDIVHSVQQVASIMADITHASEEQSLGIAQVNQAILQMDNTTQQNASLVEEATTASISMQDQAKALADMVAVFRLDAQRADQHARQSAQTYQMKKAAARQQHLDNSSSARPLALRSNGRGREAA